MHFLIIPREKLIIGHSPKSGCTTIKQILLRKLNHKIIANVHEMLNPDNLISGKYDIFNLSFYLKNNKINYDEFTKILILRNPYSRLISGIRQRSKFMCDNGFKNYTITEYLDYLKNNNYGIDGHFFPQTYTNTKIDIFQFPFDVVIDISEIKILYEILGLKYIDERLGGHYTNYILNDEKYYYYTFNDFSSKNLYNANIHNWFTNDNIKIINELYKKDFDFANKLYSFIKKSTDIYINNLYIYQYIYAKI